LEVSLAAAVQAEAERASLDMFWRQRVERARYAADRARWQYQLVAKENRLVVRHLEKDWGDRCRRTAKISRTYFCTTGSTPSTGLAEADRLDHECQEFCDSRSATLSTAERDAIRRPVSRIDQLSYFPRLLALITELAVAGQTTRQIADRLNAEGRRPAKRTTRFGPSQVRHRNTQHGPSQKQSRLCRRFPLTVRFSSDCR
jgi:hypothetical protein